MAQASPVTKQSAIPRILAWLVRLPLESFLVLLLVVIAVMLRFLALQRVATDYDEGVYWQSLRAMANGYPLYTSVFSSQPPLFLLSIYPLYRFFALFSGPTLGAARLAIALYSIVGLIAIYFAARLVGGRWVGLLALALLAADPFYLKESYTLQAEAPAVAWQLVALALAVAAMRSSGKRRRLLALAGGVALGIGIQVKLFDVFVLIPMALYLLVPVTSAWYTEGNRLRFRGRDALVAAAFSSLPDIGLLLAGCILTMLLVLLPYAGSWGTVYDQVIMYHLAAGSDVARTLGYNLKLLLGDTIEYPLAILAFISVVVAVRQRNWAIIPPLLWFLVSLAFLLRQQPLFDHDRLLLVPSLVLLASLIIYRYQVELTGMLRHLAMATLTPGEGLLALGAAAVLLSLFIGGVGAHRDIAQPLPQVSVEMASALRAATLPGDLIASDDQYLAGLADRDEPPQLVDTSQVRISSGYLTASELEAIITRYDIRVILFASGRFNLIPGFSAWVAANFTKIEDFGAGHALYLKHPLGGPQPA